MAIRIQKSSVDGMTGHLKITFCVEETVDGQTTCGPLETAHLESHALFLTYHGPEKATKETVHKAMMKWLGERHADAVKRKHHIEMTSHLADELKGKLVDFE